MITMRPADFFRFNIAKMATPHMLAAFAVACSMTSGAFAQDAAANYPNRELRLIVPFTPGAATDNISRAFAKNASVALGKTIIVENRDGAGTAIGTQTAKQAPADGYTLLFASSTMVSTMHAMKNPGYKISDFAPVVMLGSQVYALMIPAALPKDAKEFVAYAKKNPDKMNYAMLGPGAPSHVLAERFAQAAGFKWQDIPVRGGVPAIQAVLSNDMQGYFTTQSSAKDYLTNDKVHILAIGSEERGEFLPNVPTFKELGYPGVVEQAWFSLMVRSETPPAIVAKLREVFAKVIISDEMKADQKANGLSPYKGKLEDVPAMIEKDSAVKLEETKRLGIVPQ
jgi:tripartite-type tricarboxylate transporter receptor subunit TctC